MSKPKLHRAVSVLIVLVLLLNTNLLRVSASVSTAPLKSEAKAPQAQGASFDVRVAIRNRDGTPLRNVDITLSAYDGPYAGQPPTPSQGQG